eukprot:gene19430-biopygen6072
MDWEGCPKSDLSWVYVLILCRTQAPCGEYPWKVRRECNNHLSKTPADDLTDQIIDEKAIIDYTHRSRNEAWERSLLSIGESGNNGVQLPKEIDSLGWGKVHKPRSMNPAAAALKPLRPLPTVASALRRVLSMPNITTDVEIKRKTFNSSLHMGTYLSLSRATRHEKLIGG